MLKSDSLAIYHDHERYVFNLRESDSIQSIGTILLDENYRSYVFRYPNEGKDILIEEDKPKFIHRPVMTLNPVSMLKALACYNYQACETNDYNETRACKIIKRFTSHAIQNLKGYDEAPWGID